MLVMLNSLAWTLPFLAVPCGVLALALGRWADLAALVGFYLALGALVARARVPSPVGAEPAAHANGEPMPHLTLVHPHGVVCNGYVTIGVGYREYDAARLAALGAPHFLAAAPICYFGDIFCRLVGVRCSSASRASMVSLMRANKDLYLYPGGFVEAARHSYHADVVDVTSRGAIRLALEHGYAVRVGFAFGERKTAYNLQGPRALWRFRLWLAKRGIPAVLPVLLPFAATPRVAFSPTMRFPRLDRAELTDEAVERWHAAYVAALRALHAAHKGPGDGLVVHDTSKARTHRD
jgi:hypothetical protein